VVNQYKALVENSYLTGDRFAAAVGGRVAGGVLGGAIGGLPGVVAGAAAGGTVDALVRPSARIRVLAAIDRLSTRVDVRVRESVGRFIRAATDSAVAAKRTVRQAGARAYVADKRAFEKRLAELDEAVSSDVALRERLAEATRELDDDAPQIRDAVHTAALRGIGFLQARRPIPTGTSGTLLPGVTSRPRYLEQDRVRFMEYARVVDNPLAALDDLESGRLTLEGVEALREVYPTIYQSIVAETMRQLGERATRGRPVSYRARLQLGILLGTTTDPTLEPDFLAMFQRTFQQQPQQRQRPAATRSAMHQLASQLRTGSQSLEARLASS